ncbi:alpha-1,6-mannosyltransferase [Komagataella kurtzmanii]|nr:alpha-1,6-mannosyltransferase [Komagataella kurtzmanii]
MSRQRFQLPLSKEEGLCSDLDPSFEFKPYNGENSYNNTIRWLSSKIHKYKKLLILLVFLLLVSTFTSAPLVPHFHSNKDPRVVIILAANEGGGVQKWKGPQEWSVERSSIANKKKYASKHGYGLAIKDLTLKRRYSHEWREGWQKVDILKQTMRQHPNTEWFWWLDLHTLIMDMDVDLEEYLLNSVGSKSYRSVTSFNPIGIENHVPYTDTSQPVDLIVAQDCGGFNLGSFFVRQSEWTEALLDAWWDPALYEQMHMAWEHKEQDALETLYDHQGWIRSRTGFIPLRSINAFPPGACSDQADNPKFFYRESDRDFVVNMAGCEYGRDCWNEMEYYRKLAKRHEERWWKFW